jgi:hypothetical protein
MPSIWSDPLYEQGHVCGPFYCVSRRTSFAYCNSLPHRFRLHQTIPVHLGQGKSLLNRMWSMPFRVALVQFVQGPDTTIKRISVLQNTRTHGLLQYVPYTIPSLLRLPLTDILLQGLDCPVCEPKLWWWLSIRHRCHRGWPATGVACRSPSSGG